MMRKSRRCIIIFLVILLLGVGSGIIFLGFRYLVLMIPDYQERYLEWDTKEGVLKLERVFGFDFPENIREVKVAKTPAIDGAVLFLVKFVAEADTVTSFIDTFPPWLPNEPWRKIEFEPYKRELDRRKPRRRFKPAWFKKPIQQGKIGDYGKAYGTITIYIDTTDKNNYVVYLNGFY